MLKFITTEKQFLVQLLILLFFAVTYIFSFTEKIIFYNESIDFYKNHFQYTLLKNKVPILIALLLIFEFILSILSIVAIYFLIIHHSSQIAIVSLLISALTLITMLIGQRFAKDYSGAATIALYFLINIIGLLTF